MLSMNEPATIADFTEADPIRLAGGAIHPFTLRFADPSQEAAFVRRFTRQTAILNQWWMASAVIAMCLMGALEFFVLSDELAQAWLIRYLLVIPVLLAVTVHTWRGSVGPFHDAVRISTIIFSHASIIIPLAMIPPPANMIYYLLGLTAIIYTQGYVFLRFAQITVIGWLAVAGYTAAIFLSHPSSEAAPIYQSAFLVVIALAATFNHYHQETYIRRDFRQNQVLLASLQRQKDLAFRAEEASFAKSNFMAMMSHELRTPLNAIVGFSELIKSEALGPVENEQYKA